MVGQKHLAGATAVAAMFSLNGALLGMWASRIPAFKDSLGLSHASLGLVLLFLAGGAILSFPVDGRISDGRKFQGGFGSHCFHHQVKPLNLAPGQIRVIFRV